jgi:hypothetical protein
MVVALPRITARAAVKPTSSRRFGRFYASFSTLDENGEPDRALAEEYVDWSGTEVLAPSNPVPKNRDAPRSRRQRVRR